MANGTVPIVRQKARIGRGTIATANTAKDGTGTVVAVFTAGGANDSIIDYLKVKALGTNIATVLRVFLNNGSTNGTATNNTYFGDFTIAATTLSEVAALVETVIPLDLLLPVGWVVNITIGTTIAAGLAVTGVGADL